jgi:hypothetical protein
MYKQSMEFSAKKILKKKIIELVLNFYPPSPLFVKKNFIIDLSEKTLLLPREKVWIILKKHDIV